MPSYLVIESREPFSDRGVDDVYDLAADLARAGNPVTLFLVENGVLAARNHASLGALAEAGVEVLADDFSLRERGIGADRLARGVSAAPLDVVVDKLAAGHKTFWH